MKYAILLATALSCSSLSAAIVVPGADGSDGVLNITTDTTIDLGLAPTGAWDANNTANTGKGIYDATKWAVVFKYSSVTVAAGKTLTFKNHASRAPVVWLVSGNVTIAGTVSLNGQIYQKSPNLSEPGPGGFRGAAASYYAGSQGGAGLGPGGGLQQNNAGHAASYGSRGQHNDTNTVPPYGNPSLTPLVGGSGGAGDPEFDASAFNVFDRDAGGGSGGGAILLASTGTITISGEIQANGGAGQNWYYQTGGGSGGGIRLIGESLAGSGKINAVGGGGWAAGGVGRIRLERATNTGSLQIVPDPSVVPLASGATALLWPPSTAPDVRLISIGGAMAPADPRASFGSAGADVALPQTTSTQAIIETVNVEQASQVQVRLTPRANADATLINATVQSVVSTTPLVVRWVATLPVNVGYSAVQVKVVRP